MPEFSPSVRERESLRERRDRSHWQFLSHGPEYQHFLPLLWNYQRFPRHHLPPVNRFWAHLHHPKQMKLLFNLANIWLRCNRNRTDVSILALWLNCPCIASFFTGGINVVYIELAYSCMPCNIYACIVYCACSCSRVHCRNASLPWKTHQDLYGIQTYNTTSKKHLE